VTETDVDDSPITLDYDPKTGDMVYWPVGKDTSVEEGEARIEDEIREEYEEEHDIYSDANTIKGGNVPRLDLNEYRETLMEEAMALNDDFLDQSEEQFAQYLSLTVI